MKKTNTSLRGAKRRSNPFKKDCFVLTSSGLAMTILLMLLTAITPASLYAMNVVNPSARDDAIDATLNGLAGADEPAELAPIKIKIQDMLSDDEYLLAKAIHLYNQRNLSNARGDLKEVLIDNPKNQTAAFYLNNIVSKVEAVKQPKEVLEEEQKGIASVENAKLGGIYGKEEFGNTDGAEKFTINATGIVSRVSQKTDDLTNKFVSAAMKLEGSMSDYKYTATANINYYNKDNRREDARLHNATWWMKNEKVQFILGDTSSYLSRYVLNGVNYRGVNLKMDLYQNMFGDIKDNITFLYGKIPYFQLANDKYIYAREIFGVRNELDIWENWEFNTSLAYILDSRSRIIKIDPNNKPKENALFGIDQVFRVIPDVWTLYEETALSYGDDDRSSDNKILRSCANYFVSDFKTKKFKLYNSYERVEPDFRSFVGLTGFSANYQVTINREHILNYLEYEPRDEVNLGLQYSRTRTNLNKKYDVQTIKDSNYKANLKIMPKNNLPVFSLRGSIWTSYTSPGAYEMPKEQLSWDSFFEIAKKLWETDLSAAYGLRSYNEFINDTNTYGKALEQVFTLSANKRFYDRIDLTPSYTFSRAHLMKKPNRPLSTETVMSHLLDLNFSAGLWDTAYFTFDYNLSRTEDFATPSTWGTNNAFTTTFSWPFTTTLGFKKKFVLSPYLSYHYSAGKANLLDRTYFAGRLEGDYYLTENSKINLSGECRENSVNDPTYVGFGDEYRVMLSYKLQNGF